MTATPEKDRMAVGEVDRLRRRATLASVSAASFLSLAKLVAWLLTGSVTVLSSLLDSLVDVVASLVILFSVRHAMRPPDRSHRYGHGKAEPLGAMAQSAFIAGSGLFLVFEAFGRLVSPEPIDRPIVGYAVMALSILVTTSLVLYQKHVVRVTRSLAIEADRTHYTGDLLTNLAVVATIALSTIGDVGWADPVVAIGIAGYLFANAFIIGRQAVDTLMDRELPSDERESIKAIVAADPRIAGFHDLRSRHSGTHRFIELHLELDGSLTLTEAHEITDAFEAKVREVFPDAEVLAHQEPAGLDDERLDHRIRRSVPSATRR